MYCSSIVKKVKKILVKRDYSVHEVNQKFLFDLPYSDRTEIIELLLAESYLNDLRFAYSRSRHRASCGYGPINVKSELKMHKIDDASIAMALDSIDWCKAWEIRCRKKKTTDLRSLAFRYGFDIGVLE